MEILTALQNKILKIFAGLPDKDAFYLTPDMHLLTHPCTMSELKEFFSLWRKEIRKEITDGK